MQTIYIELPNYVKADLINLHGNQVLLSVILNDTSTRAILFYNDIYNLTFIGTNDNYVNRR